MTEKLDLRVKLNTETHLLLDAYIELSGTTKSQVVSDLIWGNLPNRLACARVFLTKYHNNIIHSTPNKEEVNTKKKGMSCIPNDFSPDTSIAEDAGIEYKVIPNQDSAIDEGLQKIAEFKKDKTDFQKATTQSPSERLAEETPEEEIQEQPMEQPQGLMARQEIV